MIKELTNGNYYIYQISDGGCGIVKANSDVEAKVNVMNAYKGHDGSEYSATDIWCCNICDLGNTFFADKPNVIELGWTIEML